MRYLYLEKCRFISIINLYIWSAPIINTWDISLKRFILMFLFWNFTLKCKALLNQLTHPKNYLMHIIEYLTCSIIATRNNYQKKFNSISYFCLKFELTSLSLHDTFAWKVSLTYFYFKIWGTPITNTWDICVNEQFWYFFFEIWSALNHFMLKKCCFDSFAWKTWVPPMSTTWDNCFKRVILILLLEKWKWC